MKTCDALESRAHAHPLAPPAARGCKTPDADTFRHWLSRTYPIRSSPTGGKRGELGRGMDTPGGDGGVPEVGGDGGEAESKPSTPPEVQPNLETSRAALALFDAQMQRAATKVQAVHRGRLSRRKLSNIMQLSPAILAEIVNKSAKQFMQDIRNPKAGNPFELTDCSEVNVQQQLSRLRNAHRKANTSKSASSARFRWGAATVCSACGSNPRVGV